MTETGGLDIGSPDEGGGGASEQLSEEAKARFTASAAAFIVLQKEEKRSKKRDSKVARAIIQFLNDERYSHLFVLISRLVARDCPSTFILAILSLIHEDSRKVVEEHLEESGQKAPPVPEGEKTQLTKTGDMDSKANDVLIIWITRMQMVLSLDAKAILLKLMVDERNIDGTVLQLTTFVLQEFFRSNTGGKREVPFDQLQRLAVNFLQAVFEPFMDAIDRASLKKPVKKEDDEDDD